MYDLSTQISRSPSRPCLPGHVRGCPMSGRILPNPIDLRAKYLRTQYRPLYRIRNLPASPTRRIIYLRRQKAIRSTNSSLRRNRPRTVEIPHPIDEIGDYDEQGQWRQLASVET